MLYVSKNLSEKLQSSLSATSVDPQRNCKYSAERIIKFHEINMLPVPIDTDKSAGDTNLSYALFQHSGKFRKTCKLKFGNEKLKKYEKSG